MKPIEFRKRLIGGLNLDKNLNEVDPTDFIEGYDIVGNNPKAKNEKGLLQPYTNTQLAYDIGEAEATQKVYRVTMDLTGLATCDILFLSTISGLFYNYEITPVTFTFGDTAATLFTNIESTFLGVTNFDDTIFTLVSSTGFVLVFDIEIPYYSYTDYILSVENSLDDIYSTVPLIDAISTEKVGIFYPTDFCNINNDQQLFATTNTKEPVTVSATASYTSGMFLTFSTDPEINDGEEVYIYSQVGGVGQLSGVVVLDTTFTPNVYVVRGTSVVTMTPSGTYSVVKNYRTLSIIGYATKNDIINTWYYTELVRSNKLNFRTCKQIQGALDVTDRGLLYDWTDFLNQLKRLIYQGQIMTAGFLTVYNSEGLYNLDTIEVESRLQLGVNTSKVTISVATQTGVGGKVGYSVGSKREACYAVFIRYLTNDGANSSYSKASNVLWIRSTDLANHEYGLNSGRALQIKVEQIPSDFYDFIQVGIIEFTTSSWVGYSLPQIAINGEETLYIGDSGFNSESYLSFDDANLLLEQIPFVFENARSILAYNNYRLAANVNLFQEYDLTDWAQTITLTVAIREVLIGAESIVISPTASSSNIFTGINEYAKCSTEWTSYMPYDHYRYCIFVDWENGSPTSTYWIDDVSFDPADTGFTDEALIYNAPDMYYNQLYIEAKGIDLSYILPNGRPLKEFVKDIRFGRALCNRQVYTTGFGQNVFNDGADDYVSGFADGANTQTATKLALYSPDFQNTSNLFSYEAGDLLKTRLVIRDTVTTIVSNDAVMFAGRFVDPTTNSIAIDSLENVQAQSPNNIALFNYSNGGDIYIRNAAAVELATGVDTDPLESGQYFYYVKPYGVDGAYPESPTQTRFFVIPQDQWYNKETHDTSTVYKLYGGDAFPTLSAYKIAENATTPTLNNAVILFWNYNRTNTGLRSGRFPFYTLQDYLESPYLVDITYEGDRYTYDACFTPRYLFQNQVAFNPLLPQFTNQFSSLYYSNQSFGSNLAGGNRAWLPLDMKNLESKYGAITDIQTLLGQTGTNILIVWQERRLTAQYFDNTANLKSNNGELIMGNGVVLGREGQNFTEFGCEHKWTIVKGQTDTGKDVAYWICFRKTAIMRFGADGSSNIIGDISYLIENKTLLALNNGYNNDDAPAFFNGCHAVWDNKRNEYIVTLRLYPKVIDFNINANIGEFKADPELKWGFEQFPIIYESLIENNSDVPPSVNWRTHSGYDSDYFEIITIVWNEKDNKFKTYRTYSPKIYGQFNDTYVSSHPVQGNLIYEHNSPLSQALYYGIETVTAVTATTDPSTYRINGTGIQSTFPSPFAPYEREKYIVTINGKNYEVIGTGTNFLEMAQVDDDDDILPQVTITNFSYSVVNSQDPYITGVCNNTESKYFHFEGKMAQSDSALKRTEYEAGFDGLGTAVTQSFNVKSEEKYQNGTFDVQIKQDTTLSPTNNTIGENKVEGVWMKFKNIFRWGKNNKVFITIIKALETQKTK